MARFSAWLSLGVLMACGSGSSPPTAPATSGPDGLPVDYSGAYVGTAMTWRDLEGSIPITASTTVAQTGQKIFLTKMIVSSPTRDRPDYRKDYPLGPAMLSGSAFDHTMEFATAGCGQISNHYRGSFSADGEAMTITMTWIASGCAHFEISGEMRRVRL